MKKRILIVDLEPHCYSQLRRKLLANNYDVLHAGNMTDAAEHFDVRQVDLLLLDLDVPAEDVRVNLSRISHLNPGLPVIGVTERSEGSEIALRTRLNGVAEKPIALGNLLVFIDELLKDHSPWAEFRYLPPRMPGLHHGHHRPTHDFLDSTCMLRD